LPKPSAPEGLSIHLRAVQIPAPHVDVELTIPSALVASTAPSMAATAASHLLAPPTASDDLGSLPTKLETVGARAQLVLGRATKGPLHLAYAITADRAEARLDPDQLEIEGGELFLLPDLADDPKVPISLSIDVKDLGASEHAGAASSFGVGAERAFDAPMSELRRAAFIGASSLGTAVFEAHEGHDEGAWLGYTAFDPRPISADVASFRTAARQLFKEGSSEPFALLIVPDTRPVGLFRAARHARSVVVHVGVAEPWTGAVRIAVATEVLKAWVGERLWVGPKDHEGEGLFFAEGVTRYLARELLFRFGLLTPAEVAAEAEGLASVLATSPRARASNAVLGANPSLPGALPVLVARGALYATRLDGVLRAKSKGKRTMVDVIVDLYAKAKEQRASLSLEDLFAAIEREADPNERTIARAAIVDGAAFDVPDGALGPCFSRETRAFVAFDLGLDEVAARKEHRVVNLTPSGPAARAGVKETDRIEYLDVVRGRADLPATLTIERDGATKKISFKPAGATGRGVGWKRKKDVPDDRCVKE
jgi:hypothetical protein